ncbi:MAG: orotate phosphoribosyltransferase [Bacteroidia bacterium]|nr:orotate phosphoribosyltransferase [Bacteroidia bacterium]
MEKPLALSLARDLWRIGATTVRFNPPFRWSSGWLSPMYCDNRKILSHPQVRSRVADALASVVKARFAATECLAAVATGAIGHAALVAERLALPLVYVRPEPKGHGLENRIEGDLPTGAKTLVVEDLISTGAGSFRVCQALREAGAVLVGLLSIFHYGFPHAEKLFAENDINFDYLCNFDIVVEIGVETRKIAPAERDALLRWKQQPEHWRPS